MDKNQNNVLKILCVCHQGRVRSVTLANLLKWKFRHDILVAGSNSNYEETLLMLYRWADLIFVTDNRIWIDPNFTHKVVDFNVGPDRWLVPGNRDLEKIFSEKIVEYFKLKK